MNHFVQVIVAVLAITVIGFTRFSQEPNINQTLKAEIIDIVEDTAVITLDFNNLSKNYPIKVVKATDLKTATDDPLRFDQLQVGDDIFIVLDQSNDEYVAVYIERW